MGLREILRRAVAACLVVVTAGCVIHLPPSAVKVQEKDVRFLQQGATSRDEVLHKLGQPNILDGKLVSVYEWRTERGALLVGGGGPGGGGVAGIDTGSNHSRLLVVFDEGGMLRHFAFAEYRYPGLYFKEPGPSGNYFVDGSARELPTPTASLLELRRSLGGGDSQSLALLLSQNPYEALAISRDGRYVAVAPATGGIKLWDLSAGTNRTFASGLDTHGLVFSRTLAASIIDISRDARILAAGFDDAAVLWDMASGERLHVIRGLGKSTFVAAGGPAALALAPDGRSVATGGRDGTVKLWDIATGKEFSSFRIGEGAAQSLAFAPQGDLLAAATSRGDVIVVDLIGGEQLKIISGTGEPAFVGNAGYGGRRVAFSALGKTLAANDGAAVELWQVSEIRERIGLHAAAGRSAAADKHQEPATVFLLPYGKWPWSHRQERTYLAFSPDDEVLIASSNLYSVWDLNSRRLLTAWDPSRDANDPADPADLTLGPGAALLAWSEHRGNRITIQIIDLAPIIREAREGRQRAGSQGAAR